MVLSAGPETTISVILVQVRPILSLSKAHLYKCPGFGCGQQELCCFQSPA